MPKHEPSKKNEKERFSLCPQCGRKGMYHIKLKYYRCRYCGSYTISPDEKEEPLKTEFSISPANI